MNGEGGQPSWKELQRRAAPLECMVKEGDPPGKIYKGPPEINGETG